MNNTAPKSLYQPETSQRKSRTADVKKRFSKTRFSMTRRDVNPKKDKMYNKMRKLSYRPA